jgi:hypothetical protein
MNVLLGSVGVALARSEVLEGLAPYHSALDLPIARVLADSDSMSLLAASLEALRVVTAQDFERGGPILPDSIGVSGRGNGLEGGDWLE